MHLAIETGFPNKTDVSMDSISHPKHKSIHPFKERICQHFNFLPKPHRKSREIGKQISCLNGRLNLMDFGKIMGVIIFHNYFP